jgi:hypothetical protein
VSGAVVIAIGAVVYGRRAWRRTIRRATLDDHDLHVVTTAGVEHVIPRADVVLSGSLSAANNNGFATVHHPGGTLYLPLPEAGRELAGLLREQVSG